MGCKSSFISHLCTIIFVFGGSSSTFSSFKLLFIKRSINKDNRIYLWAVDDSVSSPYFNPLILVWKCWVTKTPLYMAYRFSIAPSTGNRSCSWMRCWVLSDLSARWFLILLGQHLQFTQEGIGATHPPWEGSVCLEKCWMKIT